MELHGKRPLLSRAAHALSKDFRRHWFIYLMFLPVLAYYIIFHYWPLYGAQIAFRDYVPAKGVLGSRWVGLKHFQSFFSSYYFARLLRNTLLISLYGIVFGFPAPILFALLINELTNKRFKSFVQTCTYMPHFLSTIVVCGMIIDFTSSTGVVTKLLSLFGMPPKTLLLYPQYFRTVYIVSDIWQGVGWGSIIYLAALAGVDPSLHEAATVDGASRFKRVLHVDLPTILPTIVIMLILRFGSIMSIGFEKVFLLQNDLNLSYSEVISTYVYKVGLSGGGKTDFSYATAIGFFNSVVNLVLIVVVNFIAGKVGDTSLW